MLDDKYVTMEIEKVKHIALVAHDGKKRELVDWCEKNKEILKGHFLCGTGTTARLIAERTGLPVKGYCSGPLGGDQQIGAKIVEGQIDFMIFLWDPLEAQPHDPDVKALLRIAVVYDIPIANNLATADFMLHSKYMNAFRPRLFKLSAQSVPLKGVYMKRKHQKYRLCEICYCHPRLNRKLLIIKNSFDEVYKILNSDFCSRKHS